MATLAATVDGWRNRQSASWFPSSGFSSIGSSTGASLYIASNPSGNNKYTICLRVKTPSSSAIGSIDKLSISFKMYKANSNSGTLYGSLRTTYTDSGSSDTASTFRNNAVGSEASKVYSSTSYGSAIISFLRAAEQYSGYDISEIKAQIEEKRLWFKQTYPDDYALEVTKDRPFFDESEAEE